VVQDALTSVRVSAVDILGMGILSNDKQERYADFPETRGAIAAYRMAVRSGSISFEEVARANRRVKKP
jgi:hypothetical protein